MADISTDELRTEINIILKTADLTVVSAKKIREQVEKKFNCSLLNRKKEFDDIVMDFINQKHDVNDEATSEDEEESDDVSEKELRNKSASATKRRPQPTQRKAAAGKKKRKSLTANDSGTESDGNSDSDYEVPKKPPVKRKAPATAADGTAVRRVTGFTRAYSLSPELSELMGTDSLPRHEVVKKVWAMIKDKNLYDPKNKQFAICDDALLKVMKVKRFRTFGMLKHLKPHFLK